MRPIPILLLLSFVLFGYGGICYAGAAKPSAPVSIWVASDSSTINIGTVWEINGSAGTVSRVITVGESPQAIAVDSSGKVWVANFGSDTVSKISGSTGTVRTTAVGANPLAMAVDSSGDVWVANHASGSVSEINSATGAVSRTIIVGNSPDAIAVDSSGNVWLAVGAGKDNSYLHIQGKVLEINGATGTVSRTIDVGYSPDAIAVDSFGNIWVVDYFSDSVWEINGSTGAVSRTVTVGSLPQAIAADSSGNVWVTNSGANSVSEINGATGAVSRTIDVKGNPGAIAVDPSGNVWVTTSGDNAVSEINGSTGAVSRTIANTVGYGYSPDAIAVGPADNWGISSGTTEDVFGHTYVATVPAGGSECWAFHEDGTVRVSQSKSDQSATGIYSVANKNITVTANARTVVLQIDNKGCIYSAQHPAGPRLCQAKYGTTPCKVPGQAPTDTHVAPHATKPTAPLDKAREAAKKREKAAAIAAEKRKAALKLVPKF